jgi:hypothetical protein
MYQGVRAGTIQNVFNVCYHTIGAEWTWDLDFSETHDVYVDLYISSPSTGSRSAETWYLGEVGNGVGSADYTGISPDAVSPNDFRAGAEINSDDCWEWSSLHYYGNGDEWDPNAYGGCGDGYAR